MITMYDFCVWLLSLSTIVLRFIHVHVLAFYSYLYIKYLLRVYITFWHEFIH
jgi:hypothetical protein